ncbi:hypothetical protein V1227_10750 [Lentzea sp. DG1S-22]|uniref:hypothetical protein n=1 Tax=Lentzea sp. DG1S-22 TaxID=3108822 RepID=UPI002E7981BF|nr:hypothetical protein [Lentzea sp. DG1S-22]WVH83198.1 hypothetical protein V1227_10750 [Lentzea sp. DG1S-22]
MNPVWHRLARGQVSREHHLIAVVFTLWRGGAGNSIEAFSVSADGRKSRTALGTSAPSTCSAALTVKGGFRAVVEVADAGTSPVGDQVLDRTLPGGQRVRGAAGVRVTRTGSAVRVAEPPEPGGSTTSDLVGGGDPPGIVPITRTPA